MIILQIKLLFVMIKINNTELQLVDEWIKNKKGVCSLHTKNIIENYFKNHLNATHGLEIVSMQPM